MTTTKRKLLLQKQNRRRYKLHYLLKKQGIIINTRKREIYQEPGTNKYLLELVQKLQYNFQENLTF